MKNLLTALFCMFALSLAQLAAAEPSVLLTEGHDASAGGDAAFIIATPAATYYLEKSGGGLSSLVDPDGVDWLGFHKAAGTAHKGEYRGFPNAVHRQDGNYFHPMNAATDPSSGRVEIDTGSHVRIVFTSENGQWQAQWDFFADRCDFTLRKVSDNYRYWIQYEGVPGGSMDADDYWYASGVSGARPIAEHFIGDLPAPEWFAFGDPRSARVLFMLHHQDDSYPDDYVDRADMTVFAFGRRDKEKYLTVPQSFSIGFVESRVREQVESVMLRILEEVTATQR